MKCSKREDVPLWGLFCFLKSYLIREVSSSSYGILPLFYSLIPKSGILLFGDRQLRAVGERDLKAADIGNVIGVDEVALMTAQEQPAVFFFKLSARTACRIAFQAS